jgi:hypothetical protein
MVGQSSATALLAAKPTSHAYKRARFTSPLQGAGLARRPSAETITAAVGIDTIGLGRRPVGANQRETDARST